MFPHAIWWPFDCASYVGAVQFSALNSKQVSIDLLLIQIFTHYHCVPTCLMCLVGICTLHSNTIPCCLLKHLPYSATSTANVNKTMGVHVIKLIPNTTPATSQAFSSLVTCLGQYDWCGPSRELISDSQLSPLTISLVGLEPTSHCGLPISPQRYSHLTADVKYED